MHTNPTKGDHNFFGAILYRIAFISGAKMGYVCEGRKKARLNEIKKNQDKRYLISRGKVDKK